VGWLSLCSGKPTVPEEKYIGVFDEQLRGVTKRLNEVIAGPLAQLNRKLAEEHAPYISPENSLSGQDGSGRWSSPVSPLCPRGREMK
jgi:hypothetical protein